MVRVLVAGVLMTGLAACGGGSKAAPSGSPGSPVADKGITAVQSEVLASVLTKNYDAGGVVFSAAMPGAAGSTVTLQGMIDYTKDVAQATLVSGNPQPTETQLIWTSQEVLEGFAGLPMIMAAMGKPDIMYLSRALTTTSATDVLMSLLIKTASTQRENPQLLAQGDSRFLRTDTLRGVPVDVYRFGAKTTYWVAQSDGVLQRLEANLASAPGATVIDFLEHKAVTIPGPKLQQVGLAVEFPEAFKALTGRAPAADPRANAKSDGSTSVSATTKAP